MNLFNIGVEGQYQMGAFFAAAAGGAIDLPPGFLHVLFILLVAMVVGSLWAGLAGLLKTTRGISEVISTIMLNVDRHHRHHRLAVGGLARRRAVHQLGHED